MADKNIKIKSGPSSDSDTLFPKTKAENVEGILTIEQGGTGADDTSTARTNLDIYSKEEVESKITSVEGDITSLESRVGTAESNITTNTNNISTNTSNISSLQTSVNSINSEITDIKNSIPTKLSDLENDSDFTTKAYVEDLIANITEFNVDVVETLPSTGERGTIYLIHHEHESGDTYDEYIYVETTGAWEKIGNTDINLEDYTTLTAFNELSKYVDEIEERLTAAESNISKKADKEDLDNLSDTVTTNTTNITSLTSRVESAESNISTNTSNITTNTNNIKTNTDDIATIKGDYVKEEDLDEYAKLDEDNTFTGANQTVSSSGTSTRTAWETKNEKHDIFFGIGATGHNRGIYDDDLKKWLINYNSDDDILIGGTSFPSGYALSELTNDIYTTLTTSEIDSICESIFGE